MKKICICGLDEAGRGALAGPLSAAAVICPHSKNFISRRTGVKLRDSKLLTAKEREKIYSVLKKLNCIIKVEIISARSINNHGIGWANREIMRRLVKKLDADSYIIDGKMKIGRVAGKTKKIQSVVDADATITEVICAGIVAKVERDAIMHTLHKSYPEFCWHKNAGYGTLEHLTALTMYRATRFHRNIFITTALRHFAHPAESAYSQE